MNHSATPWRIAPQTEVSANRVVDAHGVPVADVRVIGRSEGGTGTRDDAPFIVRACSAHDELVGLLKEASRYRGPLQLDPGLVARMDAAIAKAEGAEWNPVFNRWELADPTNAALRIGASDETGEQVQPHVVVMGNPIEGIEIFGPFASQEAAASYCETLTNIGGDYWMAPLYDPRDGNRHYHPEVDNADDGYPPPCTHAGGHEWNRTEAEADEARLSGDVENDNIRCIHCGADGDA